MAAAFLAFSRVLHSVLSRPVILSLAPARAQEDREFFYDIQFPEDYTRNRGGMTKRVEMLGLKKAEIGADSKGRIRVRLAATDEELKGWRALFEPIGRLEARRVGSRTVHEDWTRSGTVPEGFEPVENSGWKTQYDHLAGDKILLGRGAVVTGQDIATAEASRESGVGRWRIEFERTSDGTRRFNEATRVPFTERPRGVLAIVVDGRILATPVVHAEEFGSRGMITGNFGRSEATNLAIALRNGALPFPIRFAERSGDIEMGQKGRSERNRAPRISGSP